MLLELSSFSSFPSHSGVGCYRGAPPVDPAGPCLRINLPHHPLTLNLVCLISKTPLCCSFFFFLVSFFALKNFFLAYFFLSDGGGLGRRKPLSINRHFHQVFLNYHVGSQPLLCKCIKKKSFQCRNPPWDCQPTQYIFSGRPLGTACLELRKAKVAASCNSMI